MATEKFKVTCKDSDDSTLTLKIFDDGTTDINSNNFTAKFNALEIKHSLDAILGFTQILEGFNLNSIEVEKI